MSYKAGNAASRNAKFGAHAAGALDQWNLLPSGPVLRSRGSDLKGCQKVVSFEATLRHQRAMFARRRARLSSPVPCRTTPGSMAKRSISCPSRRRHPSSKHLGMYEAELQCWYLRSEVKAAFVVHLTNIFVDALTCTGS